MNRIDATFKRLKAEKRKALILFLSAGDPDIKTTARLIPPLFEAGADIIEIGVPFSDPLADGPTIQSSFIRALKKGVSIANILEMVKTVRKQTDKPLVLMSAYNLVYNFGIEAFAVAASKAGVDGLILPDLIPEEAKNIIPIFKKYGIHAIFLAAPTSGEERLRKIGKSSGGFLYYISVKGITGNKKPDISEIRNQVALIRKVTNLPVACGFGISNPKQAYEIGKITDGVIIGSALVKILGEGGSASTKFKSGIKFVESLRRAIDKIK